MPKIQLVLQSDGAEGRPIDDPILMFLLESKRAGRIREAHGISVDSKQLRVDAAPDDYTVQIEMEGYRDFVGKFTIKSEGVVGNNRRLAAGQRALEIDPGESCRVVLSNHVRAHPEETGERPHTRYLYRQGP